MIPILSGFVQIIANFRTVLKTVRIFPDDLPFSGRFLPLIQLLSRKLFRAPLKLKYILYLSTRTLIMYSLAMSWEVNAPILGLLWETVCALRPEIFLRVESCYPESFWFLCHCFDGGWRLWSWKKQEQEVGKTIWPDSDSDSLHHDMTGNGWSWINWELLLHPTFNLSQEPQLNVGQCLGWSC